MASSSSSARPVFLGVEVGTRIACAGVFDENGKLLGVSSYPILIWEEDDYVEVMSLLPLTGPQSSTDIWLSVGAAVKAACSRAGVDGEDVTGIGFAAKCSLVSVDADGEPVTVSRSDEPVRNVIESMDHRAVKQAEKINKSNSLVLQYYGGALSPEMEPPRLLWVKENLKESWSKAFRWMDLSDWLSYKATGDDTRSLCTVVCKWTYLGHAHMDQRGEKESRSMEACGWDDEFWQEIGLGDLVDGHHAKIGRSVAFPGHPLGSGLTPAVAKELGLREGIPLGTSLIDAHAAVVGVMVSVPPSDLRSYTYHCYSEASGAFSVSFHNVNVCSADDKEAICHRMVLVCEHATCHMVISKRKLFIPGVCGPFWSAMLPEYWLTESGQKATGALLINVVLNHMGCYNLAKKPSSHDVSMFGFVNDILEELAQKENCPFMSALTRELHVIPNFYGIRSPIDDSAENWMVCGLTPSTSEKQLALHYLATIQSIAYGVRHLVESCNAHGHQIDTLVACGCLAKNPLYIQEHADITGYPVILPRESDSVLLGAAILGAVAAKKYSSLHEAMKALSAAGSVIYPSKDPKVKKYHDAKYHIFRDLYEKQFSYRSIMSKALS